MCNQKCTFFFCQNFLELHRNLPELKIKSRIFEFVTSVYLTQNLVHITNLSWEEQHLHLWPKHKDTRWVNLSKEKTEYHNIVGLNTWKYCSKKVVGNKTLIQKLIPCLQHWIPSNHHTFVLKEVHSTIRLFNN